LALPFTIEIDLILPVSRRAYKQATDQPGPTSQVSRRLAFGLPSPRRPTPGPAPADARRGRAATADPDSSRASPAPTTSPFSARPELPREWADLSLALRIALAADLRFAGFLSAYLPT